jgi:hypothetical protein
MQHVELLTVQKCYECGAGVLLHPDFSVPKSDWHKRTEVIVVVKPDGTQFKTRANIDVVHFNIAGQATLDERYRVVVGLPACEKDDVPVGSKILASQEIRDALYPENVA